MAMQSPMGGIGGFGGFQGQAQGGGMCGAGQGNGGQVMAMPGLGHHIMGGAQAMGGLGSQFGGGAQSFGGQAMGHMGNMPSMGNMPFSPMRHETPLHQQGRRTASHGSPSHAGKRRFGTQCHCYSQIPMSFKIEVLQTILPEVWNPVSSAHMTILDMDCSMLIGFDRRPGSLVETRFVTNLA